jgi:hypothetical protein
MVGFGRGQVGQSWYGRPCSRTEKRGVVGVGGGAWSDGENRGKGGWYCIRCLWGVRADDSRTVF